MLENVGCSTVIARTALFALSATYMTLQFMAMPRGASKSADEEGPSGPLPKSDPVAPPPANTATLPSTVETVRIARLPTSLQNRTSAASIASPIGLLKSAFVPIAFARADPVVCDVLPARVLTTPVCEMARILWFAKSAT